MTLLHTFLERLPKLRSSQDFAVIIPELRNRLSIIEAEGDDLKIDLENSLFESAERRTSVRAEISANLAEQEELRLALTGAEHRRLQAQHDEMGAEVERRMKDAKNTQLKLRDSFIGLDKHLSEAVKLIEYIQSAERKLAGENAFAREHGRGELQVENPLSLLRRLFGHDGHVFEHPNQYSIPGYLPKHPDGPGLSRMKDVVLQS